MKIKLLSFVLTIFLTQINYSQELDWQSGTFSEKEQKQKGADYGTMTSFKIKNINKFLYSVTISGSSIDLNTPIPTELQTLFRLPSSSLAATTNNQNVDNAAITTDKQIKNLNTVLATQISAAFAAGTDTSELEEAKIELERVSDIYLSQIRIVASSISSLKQARVKFVNCAQMDVSYDRMQTEISAVRYPADFTSQHQTMLTNYSAVESAYQAVRNLTDDDEIITAVDKSISRITTALKAIENEHPETLYSDIEFLKSELSNQRNFVAIAPPVQADADLINYEIKITPSQTNTLGPHKNNIAFDFDVPVKGGWKADFSVGPTFSFGDKAKDEKYYLEESTTTPGNVILRNRDNNNAISPGLAAMMHFYPRRAGNVAYGGMFGVGAGFQGVEDADLSFYAGVSVILGKREKIIASLGISYLNVNRIKSDEFKADTEYESANIDLNNVTEKVLEGSFFLSISYAISQAKVK
ncbi:hypothetical protein [Flavobacterium panici]|nr:hypothetical protein [Flavobacterium panici]